MMRGSLQMAKSLCRISKGTMGSPFPSSWTQLKHPSPCASINSNFIRTVVAYCINWTQANKPCITTSIFGHNFREEQAEAFQARVGGVLTWMLLWVATGEPSLLRSALPWPFSSQPRDFSLPNSSWGPEMMRLYEHYNSQCEVETAEGEKKRGPWRKLPSYNRSLKYATGGVYLSKIIQSEARLFTRSIKVPGAAFEYVMFVNKEEQRCVCLLQAGRLLEGPPGHVHGGAIATMIDSVTGTHATYLSGPVMTANLNINYRSPIPLGSTVLLESSLDKKEGRKTFVTCKVTSTDGSKLHTEATGLFLSVNLSHILGV